MAVTPAEAEAWHAARAVDTEAPPHPHGFSVAAEAGRPPSMIRACPRPIKLTARVACKSMNRAQEQKHLAQANGHIAELKVQIVRQRVIVKYALDTDQPSEMAESMLHALEESLGAFEKHRELVLDQLKRRPSE
jgi:hypothetical protein